MPFGSLLFQSIVSTPEMRSVWSEENTLSKWIEVEKAITLSQAELGLIPADAARTITENLTLERITAKKIQEKREEVGHLMVAFLKVFREVCGPAAEHFHIGPTTQDIFDTALTLQVGEARDIISAKTLQLEKVLCKQAIRFKSTPYMARTHKQPAVPVTFGFVLAGWAGELDDHITRMREGERRFGYGTLSGAAGAHNSFVELWGLSTARELEVRMCRKLSLRTPLMDIHPRTDRFAELGAHLAGLCSFLGRIAMNLRSWQRPEVMEVTEPYAATQYSSSTMPNKRNPEGSEQVEGLATLCRCLSLAIQEVQMCDQRDSTRIPVEITAIPQSFMMTDRALLTSCHNLEGMVVSEEAMLRNINHPNTLGQTAGERLMVFLYRKTGLRDSSHTKLHDCAARSANEQIPFSEAVLQDRELAEHFTGDELNRLMDLTTYLGSASQQAEQMVRAIERKRRAESGERLEAEREAEETHQKESRDLQQEPDF